MKAHKFFVPKHGREAIRIERDELVKFYPLLHYHEDVQITLIKNGSGILFAGAGFTPFEPGDVFILGSNLPHVFKSARESKKSIAISIYFDPFFGGAQFWNLDESKALKSLIEQSRAGIKFVESISKSDLTGAIERLQEMQSSTKLAQTLLLLDKLSNTEKKLISGIDYSSPPPKQQTKRMDNVINYVSNNFQNNISLEDISAKAHLSKEAFCRFFKRKTRKTFTSYLNEIRVSHATRLLLESEYSVSEIADKCGFRNLSNFNRQFLKISGKSPREVRKIS